MTVTEIKPVNSKKSRIYIDEEFAFILYKSEIRRYHLEEGGEVSEKDYEELVHEVLLKRGRARALHLLEAADRTEGQLRVKLQEGGYPAEVIEQVLDYVKDYHYIDDFRYASAYFRNKGSVKSVRQMQTELRQKGVSPQTVQEALENEESIDESAAIRRWMEKKHIDPEQISQEQLRRFYQFLLRRGFQYEDIQRELRMQ